MLHSPGAMRIRFQADADLDEPVLRGLRRVGPEVDIQTAAAAGLAAMEDAEVLRSAAEAGRILISQDRSTMPRHFQRFPLRSRVILLRARVPIAVATEELVLIWAASEAAEWINRLVGFPYETTRKPKREVKQA
jgi:Domain of unknown function (DUF5615)